MIDMNIGMSDFSCWLQEKESGWRTIFFAYLKFLNIITNKITSIKKMTLDLLQHFCHEQKDMFFIALNIVCL